MLRSVGIVVRFKLCYRMGVVKLEGVVVTGYFGTKIPFYQMDVVIIDMSRWTRWDDGSIHWPLFHQMGPRRLAGVL